MRYMVGLIALLLLGCADDGNSSTSGSQSSEAKQESESASGVEEPVRVWADNQLSIPLEALDEMFMESYAPGYQVTYWDCGELAERLAGKSPIDAEVILTGSQDNFESWLAAGILDDSLARSFAGDSLVLLKRKGETWRAQTLFDIYRLLFKWVGYGSEATLSGTYAHQALISSGVHPRIDDRLKRFDSDVEVIAALQVNEIQLGMVLRSSAKPFKDLEVVVPIGEDLHEDIRYRALVPMGQSDRPGVKPLLKFLAEDMQVQFNLEAMGFARRETAMHED